MKPPPAFQCYASNIIANKQYRLMTLLDRGVWISIYLECWPNISVPANPVDLAKYLGFSVADVESGLTPGVLSFFEEKDSELISHDHEEYREKIRILRLKQSEGGKKGAEIKRNIASNIEGHAKGVPEGSLIQSNLKQFNQNQSIKKINNLSKDPFIKDMENYEKDHKVP